MNDILKLEELIKLGEENKNKKNYDQAIHYYNRGLRLVPDDIKINTELAELYTLKAEENTPENKFYYQLAMEHFRKILKTNPSDEELHKKLILLAKKTNTLDELAVEYNEKLKKTTDVSLKYIYEDCLKRIYDMTLLDKNISIPKIKDVYYEPSLPVKIIFDFLLLPMSLSLLALSIFHTKFRPLFTESIILLVFYFAYRIVIITAKK